MAAGFGLIWVVWTRTTVGVQQPNRNALRATIVDSTLREPARRDTAPTAEVVAQVAVTETASPDTAIRDAREIASADLAPPALMVAPPAAPVSAPSASALAPETPRAEPRARPRPSTAPKSVSRARWVRATARDWVRLRVAAHPSSRTIALIGPDTRVQLGDSRKGWVRVRAIGISGWAESTQYFAVRR